MSGGALSGELLKQAPAANLVICEGCDATAEAPPLGVPEGWDGAWRHASGWTFTCPACLDRAEAEWRGGGTLADAHRNLRNRP